MAGVDRVASRPRPELLAAVYGGGRFGDDSEEAVHPMGSFVLGLLFELCTDRRTDGSELDPP